VPRPNRSSLLTTLCSGRRPHGPFTERLAQGLCSSLKLKRTPCDQFVPITCINRQLMFIILRPAPCERHKFGSATRSMVARPRALTAEDLRYLKRTRIKRTTWPCGNWDFPPSGNWEELQKCGHSSAGRNPQAEAHSLLKAGTRTLQAVAPLQCYPRK